MRELLISLLLASLVACASASLASAYPAVSSWYGYELAGSPTASGELFAPEGYTAASLDYPLGTHLEVCYELGCVEVVVNDRGPYVAGRGLDLSLGAAEAIGLTGAGVDVVEVYPLY